MGVIRSDVDAHEGMGDICVREINVIKPDFGEQCSLHIMKVYLIICVVPLIENG